MRAVCLPSGYDWFKEGNLKASEAFIPVVQWISPFIEKILKEEFSIDVDKFIKKYSLNKELKDSFSIDLEFFDTDEEFYNVPLK